MSTEESFTEMAKAFAARSAEEKTVFRDWLLDRYQADVAEALINSAPNSFGHVFCEQMFRKMQRESK